MNDSRHRDGNRPHLPGVQYGDQREALAAIVFQCVDWAHDHLRDIVLAAAFVLIWAVVFTFVAR